MCSNYLHNKTIKVTACHLTRILTKTFNICTNDKMCNQQYTKCVKHTSNILQKSIS